MRVVPAALLLASLSLACQRATPPPPAQQPAHAATPAGQSATSETAAGPAGPQLGSVSGTVLESLDSGGYTYLKLGTPGGEVWAAVNKSPVKKGDRVTVANAMLMQGFVSKTLNRTFDRIYFGTLGGDEAAAGSQPGAALDSDSLAAVKAAHGAAATQPVEVLDTKVARAEGPDARTVAEIYAERAALKDKPVTVRGKVVKFLPGIMGRNWLHLRDGSGSSDRQDNDLTVTTDASVSVGDVVVVRGIVRTDKDFGAGYAYAVIVEEAKLTK